jgi:peptidoglycan/LPS O-acetylase OafA/YrhL
MPAAWICGTITLIVALIVGGQSKGKLIDAWAHSVFFLPKGPYIDGAYWTLAIECAFYAIFLALIVFKSLRQIERIFCAIAVINALFCLTIFVIRPELHGLFENRLLQLMLVVHGGSFAVGIFLRGLLFEGPTALRLMGLVIGLVGGGLGVGYWVALPEDVVPSLTIWFLSVGLIAASVRFNDRLQLALDNHSLTTVRNFGLATYPLYLVHNILGAALMMRLAEVGLPHLACLVLTLIALIIVALFIAVYIEPVVRAVMRAPLEKLQLGLNNLWKTVIVRSLHVSN